MALRRSLHDRIKKWEVFSPRQCQVGFPTELEYQPVALLELRSTREMLPRTEIAVMKAIEELLTMIEVCRVLGWEEKRRRRALAWGLCHQVPHNQSSLLARF